MSEEKYYPQTAWAYGRFNTGEDWQDYPNQHVLMVGKHDDRACSDDQAGEVQLTLEQAKELYADIGAWIAEQEGKTT